MTAVCYDDFIAEFRLNSALKCNVICDATFFGEKGRVPFGYFRLHFNAHC